MIAACVVVGMLAWAGSTLLPPPPVNEEREAVVACESSVESISQNGFGAMVRTDYECTVTFSGRAARALLTEIDGR